jgi:L-ascorbate metabolism protein UlaG (beta-lactamase superfamily)
LTLRKEDDVDLSRNDFLQLGAASAAASAIGKSGEMSGRETAAVSSPSLPTLKVRWFGGGVYEIATPDDRSIALVDAWIWSNTGWTAFGIEKPPELHSAAAYAHHLRSRKPEAIFVALTHDHTDHIGDYFELLPALVAAKLPVLTGGQSDLFRAGLVPKFKEVFLDSAQVVANGGAGMNFGGTATHKSIKVWLVPAVHSTLAAYPSAGFIIEIGGLRVYASGDTDLFGDMATIGERYAPDLAVLSSGNGAFTMGPEDAARACKLLRAGHAIPVHYAHNKLVLGPQCGEMFADAVKVASPQTQVTVLRPGETAQLALPTRTTPASQT